MLYYKNSFFIDFIENWGRLLGKIFQMAPYSFSFLQCGNFVVLNGMFVLLVCICWKGLSVICNQFTHFTRFLQPMDE